MDINQLLRDEIEAAKKQIPATRPEQGKAWSNLNPYALIFCPRGILQYNFGFGDDSGEGKERKKVVMTSFAKLLDAYLVIVVMDTSMAHIVPDRYPWNKMYQKAQDNPEKMHEISIDWLKKNYGGHVHNLPDHLRMDCLFAGGKGPEIPPFAMIQRYHYTETGVVYDELKPYGVDGKEGSGYLEIIGDWWKLKMNPDAPHEMTEVLRLLVTKAIPPKLGHWREINKGAESWAN